MNPNSLFDYAAKVSMVLCTAYSTSKRIFAFEFEGKISKPVVGTLSSFGAGLLLVPF